MKTLEILQIEVDNLKKLNNELALKNNELSGEVERLTKQWISIKDESPVDELIYDVAVCFQPHNKIRVYPNYTFYNDENGGAFYNNPNPQQADLNVFSKFSLDERMITHFRPHVPVPKIEV